MIALPVEADTFMNFTVRRKADIANHKNKKEVTERGVSSNEEYTVQAVVKSQELLTGLHNRGPVLLRFIKWE